MAHLHSLVDGHQLVGVVPVVENVVHELLPGTASYHRPLVGGIDRHVAAHII